MKIKKYYKEKQYIHYSNCHEDTAFMLSQIKGRPSRILSIASALDNSLAMLLLDPDEIVAIDNNDTQIALCRLKLCGIRHLSREQFLVLLGLAAGDSGALYDSLRPHLDADARDYFDAHRYLIEQVGLAHCGRFEYYFKVFATKALPLVHGRKTVDGFMHAATLEDQQAFYRDRFCNRRFRLMFKVFFSEAVMKRLGRDKEYFKYNQKGLADVLRERFEACVAHNLNRENPYLQYILYNRFEVLPLYLRPENYQKIKQNLDKIQIKKADFSDEIGQVAQYDFMYLSDIFEYMPADAMQDMTQSITRALRSGGQVLFYNMINPRRLGAPLRETCVDQTSNLTFYYTQCYSYTKQND